MDDAPCSQGHPTLPSTLSPLTSPLPISPSPKRRLTDIPRSPSSPDLSRKEPQPSPRPLRTVSRSKTLPLRSHCGTQPASIPTLDGVTIDAAKVGNLRRWILGLAVVKFDLDVGPVLSCLFPPFRLYPFEAENIAFSAFPDSAQFREGAEMHSFRIRGRELSLSHRPSSVNQHLELVDDFIYGYSYFNQQKDPTSRRGYAQWSIVILSPHPYPALFSSILSKLGPLFQSHGEPILEVASHNIANWPPPHPGQTIELGFLGSVLQAELPLHIDEQQLSNTAHLHAQTEQDWHILACAPPASDVSLTLFEASVTHLWSIWECLVLCEPILIFGPSPAMTSQAVWWLRDLFRPIPWTGDFRPYFTIHDKEHNTLVNGKPPKAGLLLGVTNPFFTKACGHWPHILSLGKASPNRASDTAAPVAGPSPGWVTKTHRRFISKDRQVLQQMEDAFRSRPESLPQASQTLRRHFSSRTAALLVPLNRYLNTLIPSPAETLRNHPTPPRLRPFNHAHFLTSLKTHGAPLPFRSNTKQRQFYEQWLRTPAFGLWLAKQEEIVTQVLSEKARA